jgi:Transcriptional regulators
MGNNKKKYLTKSDYIYENLKDQIVEGKLSPGERIMITEVAKETNISAMPIREALNRLQQDGLVEIIPHLGVRVASMDMATFQDIWMIRAELEVLAAKLSTPYIDKATLAKLENLQTEMEKCVKNGENARYSKLNKEFHQLIYSAGPHQFLADLIISLWNRSEFTRTIFMKFSEQTKVSLQHHAEWLEAIRAQDGDQAGLLVRKQFESANPMVGLIGRPYNAGDEPTGNE